MEQLFTVENLVSLGMFILLQAVLGFDNLLYISPKSKRAPAERQAMVRRIGIAIVLRIALLFALIELIQYFQEPIFSLDFGTILSTFSLHSLIVLGGGVLIIYTATKEISHMISVDELEGETRNKQSVGKIISGSWP